MKRPILASTVLLLAVAAPIAATAGPTRAAEAATSASCPGRSAYDDLVLSDKPMAYWRLGETTSTANDCSGHGRTGSYVSSPARTAMPNGNRASAFDGATEYVQIPDADYLSVPTTGILTLEAWMRPDTLQFTHQEGSGYVHWMGKGVMRQHEYVARMYSKTNSENRPNRISGYAFNLSGDLGAGSFFQDPVAVGQWIHVTVVINTLNRSSTYPTGYIRIYKNGNVRDTDSLQGYDIVPRNGTAPFRIGSRDLNSFFRGAIGKVAVYNYELSRARVLAHYTRMTA